MSRFSQILKYALSSGASWVIDNGLFLLLKILLAARVGGYADLLCTVIARAFSSFVNFNANNKLVFAHKGNYGGALLRYYCLAVPIMLCSAGLVTLLDRLFGVTAPALSTLIKICVDGLLFVASYLIQKKWVFPHSEEPKE